MSAPIHLPEMLDSPLSDTPFTFMSTPEDETEERVSHRAPKGTPLGDVEELESHLRCGAMPLPGGPSSDIIQKHYRNCPEELVEALETLLGRTDFSRESPESAEWCEFVSGYNRPHARRTAAMVLSWNRTYRPSPVLKKMAELCRDWDLGEIKGVSLEYFYYQFLLWCCQESPFPEVPCQRADALFEFILESLLRCSGPEDDLKFFRLASWKGINPRSEASIALMTRLHESGRTPKESALELMHMEVRDQDIVFLDVFPFVMCADGPLSLDPVHLQYINDQRSKRGEPTMTEDHFQRFIPSLEIGGQPLTETHVRRDPDLVNAVRFFSHQAKNARHLRVFWADTRDEKRLIIDDVDGYEVLQFRRPHTWCESL